MSKPPCNPFRANAKSLSHPSGGQFKKAHWRQRLHILFKFELKCIRELAGIYHSVFGQRNQAPSVEWLRFAHEPKNAFDNRSSQIHHEKRHGDRTPLSVLLTDQINQSAVRTTALAHQVDFKVL